MVGEAPLGHDRAAARDDAGDAVGGERHIGEAHASVNGEVVDALLALLDQRVLVALPVEFHGVAVDLLQRLVDRHGADGHRRVADDPFAGVVDVPSGGKIHHRVGAPADRPRHLLHLLLDRGGDGGVADIGVDLGEEVAADDHRLQFAVVDVRGDDGAAARHFRTHEFGRHEQRHRGAKALAVIMRRRRGLVHLFAPKVLALGDVDHLLGDDAGPRPFELGQGLRLTLPWRGRVGAERRGGVNSRRPQVTPTRSHCVRSTSPLQGEVRRRSAQRLRRVREIARQVLAADIAVVDRLHRAAVILLDAAALLHPVEASARQAALDVDRRVRIGVRAGRVIDRDRRLAGGSIERDFAQRHLEVRRRVRPHVDLARAGDRAGRDLGRGKVGFGDMLVHRCTPFHSVVVPAAVICSPADNPGS